MKKDKQQSSFVNIGSSSLLIIFLVLCLATFAILSLSSARSDYSFSERLASHKTEYYEASAWAETVTGEIDDALFETADKTGLSGLDAEGIAATSYGRAVMEVLDGAEFEGIPLSCVPDENNLTVSFRIPLGEKQALAVALLVTDYRSFENYYEVKSWKVVSTGAWDGDQPLNLMPVME